MAHKKQKRQQYFISKSGDIYWWKFSFYEEWYEYAKLAKKLPKDFKAKGTFDEWLDPKLFAEPVWDNDIKILSHKDNKLVLEFDLTHDYHRLGIGFLKILELKCDKEYKSKSTAKFPINISKNHTVRKMKERRQAYVLKQQKVDLLEIAKRLDIISDEAYQYKINNRNDDDTLEEKYEIAIRRIEKNCAACKKTLINIEKGIFP